MPETPEEGEKAMATWTAWYGELGDKVRNGGAPCGQSHTVSGGGVVANGGPNPVSGFTLVAAENQDEANKMAAGCPIIDSGGNVEVCQLKEM